MTFQGIPAAAFDFYTELTFDNSRDFWLANAERYRNTVREPLEALMAELEDEFGTAKIFRPNRDVRFSNDKTPYKTHQGAYVATLEATGFYLQLDGDGVLVGGGWYRADPDHLAAIRSHLHEDGSALRTILDALAKDGWERGGDQIKTSPRGWPSDHPMIDLLRYKTLFVSRRYSADPVLHTADFADLVRTDWRALRPMLGWLEQVPG